MTIVKIDLDNFRNHKKASFSFSESSTLISGANGVGKTNILEAVHLLSIGKSFRAPTEKDVVNLSSPYAKITGYFSELVKLELTIEKISTGRVKKTFKKNNVAKSTKDFVGIFKTVLFNPEDIRLILGSPSRRRDYVDGLLSQVHPEYYKAIHKYERILKHRNKVLELSKGQVIHNIFESQLEIWDRQLVEVGTIVQDFRKKFFVYLNENIKVVSFPLLGSVVEVFIKYNLSNLNSNTLMSHRMLDLRTCHTGVGPHRDDFDFILNVNSVPMDLQNYGSRGQQRMSVLCLKVLELKYIEEISGQKPVLLLDDIFSELDDHFRKNISEIMKKYQTIVTSAEHVDLEFGKVIKI